MKGNLFRWWSKGAADPNACSCLGGIGNECLLTLIESTGQKIFFYRMKSFIPREMKNGNWHFASAVNYIEPSWTGKTSLFKERRENSDPANCCHVSLIFQEKPNSRCSCPGPLLSPLCFSLSLPISSHDFFSHWFKNFKYCAFYTTYTCEPDATLHFTVCALCSFLTWGQEKWSDLPELVNSKAGFRREVLWTTASFSFYNTVKLLLGNAF